MTEVVDLADGGRRRWVGLLTPPVTTLLVGLVCAAVSGTRTGGQGAVSALLGTLVVASFFWTGLLPILLTRGQEHRAALGLAVLLVNYTLRLALALLALRAAEGASLIDTRVLGLSIIVATLTWTSTQVARLGRSDPAL